MAWFGGCAQEREGTDERLMQAGKRAREGHAKVQAVQGGRTRAQVKLDAGKHRRTSRTQAKQRAKQRLAMDLLDP